MPKNVQFDDNFKNALKNLKESYNSLPWYKRLFYPSALSLALSNYNESDPTSQSFYDIFMAFQNDTWSFQKYFFDALYKFSQTKFFQCFEDLGTRGLLSRPQDKFANFETILQQSDPQYIPEMLQLMHNVGLLEGEHAQANRDAIAKDYSDSSDIKLLIK